MKFFILIFSKLVVVVDVPLCGGGQPRMGSLAAKMCLGCGVCVAHARVRQEIPADNNMHDATACTHK